MNKTLIITGGSKGICRSTAIKFAENNFDIYTCSRNIDDLSWIPFNTTGTSDTAITPAEDNDTFREYKYSVSGVNEFTAFQIKIVMKGTNSSYPPVIKDMRGIALAV